MGTFISNHKNNYNDIKRAIWESLGNLQELVQVLEKRSEHDVIQKRESGPDPLKAEALAESFLGQAQVQYSLFLKLGQPDAIAQLTQEEYAQNNAKRQVLLMQSAALICKALEAVCRYVDETCSHVGSGSDIKAVLEKIEPFAEKLMQDLVKVTSVRDYKVSHEKYGLDSFASAPEYMGEWDCREFQSRLFVRFALCDLMLQAVGHVDHGIGTSRKVTWLRSHAQALRNVCVLEERQASIIQNNVEAYNRMRIQADDAAKEIVSLFNGDTRSADIRISGVENGTLKVEFQGGIQKQSANIRITGVESGTSEQATAAKREILAKSPVFSSQFRLRGNRLWKVGMFLSLRLELSSDALPDHILSDIGRLLRRKVLADRLRNLLGDNYTAAETVAPKVNDTRSEDILVSQLLRLDESDAENADRALALSQSANLITSATCVLTVVESSFGVYA